MALIYNDAYGIKCSAAYECIKDALYPIIGKIKRGISEKKALSTTQLTLGSNDITNLDFLEFFPNLKELTLYSKKLSNIDGLRYVSQLTSIALMSDWPGTIDISAIGNCKDLILLDLSYIDSSESLDLDSPSNVDIKGLDVLAQLSDIESLSLYYMGIKNINFVKKMTKLEDADLSGNHITDFSPLCNHPTLELLDLSYCGITNISFLSQMPTLQMLNLEGNNISDFTPLQDHPAIAELDLADCGLTNISFITRIPTLTNLCLDFNEIEDFSPLKELEYLECISAEDNELSLHEIERWKAELGLDEMNF